MKLSILSRRDGVVNCQRRQGQTCAAGHYRGTVGLVLCASCPHREPIDAAKPAVEYVERAMTAGEIAHGAKGLARAIAGIDRATDDVRATRLKTCKGCEHNSAKLGMFPACGLCGCVLGAKIADARESCPAGKWPVTPSEPIASIHSTIPPTR